VTQSFFKKLRPGDFLLGAALLAGAAWTRGIVSSAPRGSELRITVENTTVFLRPMDQDTDFTVRGPIGETVVKIHGGSARVSEASCPRHVCLHSGAVRKVGEVIVCVPNHLVLEVVGESDRDVDATTR
jgi:hypothetical protein